jgi:predicted nuclease of restriction endonuclease-like (RecB) superfamily
MGSEITSDRHYTAWLTELKKKVRGTQLKAAVKVNTELLHLYWELGADIVAKQTETTWGDGFLSHLSRDLSAEFPEMKGFSLSNLKYIKQWHLFYRQNDVKSQQLVGQLTNQAVSQLPTEKSQQSVGLFGQQPVAQILQIPWGHNIAIISKCKNIDEALYYVQNTITHGWSRSVLVHQIESGLFQREGRSVNNFSLTLPAHNLISQNKASKTRMCSIF